MTGTQTPSGVNLAGSLNEPCDDTGGDARVNPDIVSGGPVLRAEEHVMRIQEALGLEQDGMLGPNTSLEIARQIGDVNDPAILAILMETQPEVAESIQRIQEDIGKGMFKQHDPSQVEAECVVEGGGITGLDGLLPEGDGQVVVPDVADTVPTHEGGTDGTIYSYTPEQEQDHFYGKSEHGLVYEGADGLYIEGENGYTTPVLEGGAGYYIETPAGQTPLQIVRPDEALDVAVPNSGGFDLEGAETLLHEFDPADNPMDGIQTLPYVHGQDDGGQMMLLDGTPLLLSEFGVDPETSFSGADTAYVGEPGLLERFADFAEVQIGHLTALFDGPDASADTGPEVQMADIQVDTPTFT